MTVKRFFLLFLIFGVTAEIAAQDQRKFDSLTRLYHSGQFPDSLKFIILSKIAFNSNDPDTSLYYADLRYQLAENDKQRGLAHHSMGNAYRIKGDYTLAVEHYIKSIQLSRSAGYRSGIANSTSALGDVYSVTGNHKNSVLYYNQAIKILREERDSTFLGTVLLNLGDEYFNVAKMDSALIYFQEAGRIFEAIDYSAGKAYNIGNIGLVYAELGDHDMAEQNISEAVNILEIMEDYYGISAYLTYMADIYIEKENYSEALKYAGTSFSIATNNGLKEQIRDASLKLAEIYELNGQISQAYEFHKKYVAYRDSVNNEETIQKIADLRTEFEVGQKQAEVDLLTIQKRNQNIILFALTGFAFILVILAFIIYKYYQSKARTNRILETQKRELEALNQTKDKFFSIISHDLRGPVSSFHGISRMIKFLVQTKDTDQLLEITDDIDQSVDRVSALLDNLLSWAMQQQGHFPNVPEKVDLKELADELVQTLKTMAKGKNIELSSEIHSPVSLWVDKNTTMTILRNLVNNALKFTPEGGSVTISASEKGDFAAIRVSDTGVGIPKEKLHKLFRLQDKKSTYGTSGEKGLGLGLQLVYEFVEMNGGAIEVSSTEKEGTTFTVKLPLFESERVEV